jgi:hypothetical protein
MKLTAVLSMLHEPANRPNSATRRFRGEAPLAWTLYRLAQSKHISQSAILCWEDQSAAVDPIAGEMKATKFCRSPRISLPHLDGVAAARRWSDGWRGALMGACEFDRGFHGRWAGEILDSTDAEGLLLVDPSAALVDAGLIDALIDHAAAWPDVDLCFSTAAPGLSGVLLRKSLVRQLAAGGSHPGTLLAYRPDLPMKDPVATPSCAPVATPLARTLHRFTLDSERQIDRIGAATTHLNGQLISTEAGQLLQLLDGSPESSPLPRDIVLELNTRRETRPIFSPIGHVSVERPDMPLELAKQIFAELAAADDVRIVLAGVGDPLLHPQILDIIDCAVESGIGAIAIETDLLGIDANAIQRLADSAVDVITVNLPAIRPATYQKLMGVDSLKPVMENLSKLVARRQSRGRGTPLFVPSFVKTAENLAEMEAWYDHWLRVLGCAVINGPGDFAGQIPDVSLVQMEPPKRRGCSRIKQRLTILCDGQIVSCEQDFRGTQPLGRIGENSIADVWTGAAAELRRDHACGNWQKHALCAACKDWHRP